MVSVTNNTHDFFEKNSGEIMIYGAGNSGYWIGYYMNRCKMEFSCYLDKIAEHENLFMNGKPVFRPDKLGEYQDRSLRIIISANAYESVITDLVFLEQKYHVHLRCLVPRYKHFIWGYESYNINKFLAYFRRRLYTGTMPTIISNDCIAGGIYNLMGMFMLSPTINTWIEPEDYAKLCLNPRRYFNCEGGELFWNYLNKDKRPEITPAMKLEDITVSFAHTKNTEGLVERWNRMRQRINWNNLIFAFRGHELPVPQSFREMLLTEHPNYLIVRLPGSMRVYHDLDYLCLERNYFEDPDYAIENVFDLLGWLNQCSANSARNEPIRE